MTRPRGPRGPHRPRRKVDPEFINSIAISFYNAKLRDNPTLRRSCSDRHVLDDTIGQWKAEERLDGRQIKGVSPSGIIFSLKKKKIIDSKVTQENIIIWKADIHGTNNENEDEETGRTGAPKTKTKKADKASRVAATVERIRNSRMELESDRNGIIIDNIGWEEYMYEIGQRVTQEVSLRNESDIDVLCTVKDGIAKQRGFIIEGESNFELPAGSRNCIIVSFIPKIMGITKSILVFDFSPIDVDEEDSIESFSIARYISIRAGNPEDYDMLKPSAPYVKKRERYDDFSNPTRVKSTGVKSPFVTPLGRYTIPKEIEKLAANKREARWKMDGMFRGEDTDTYVDVENDNKIDYSSFLTMNNYAECQQHLLWMEEAQMQVDIKTYDLSDTVLEREGRHYKLHVPGLAENRPSVLKGDKIIIKASASGKKFEGLVTRTTQEMAYMDLPRAFSSVYINGLRVDVRFTFSRTTLRTSHQALMVMGTKDETSIQSRMIFPRSLDMDNPPLTPLNTRVIRSQQLNFYNRSLNAEQQTAVVGVLQSVARPAPYVIYGPPGTGKTVTLVESILQTLHAKGSDPNVKILVCAPSNTAVDVVVQRLSEHNVNQREMLRLLAFSRDKSTVPENIFKYTNYNEEEDCFITPDPTSIRSYKIVAVTVSYAGRLPNNGILNHFTHVFIDEAGHSVESEALGCMALTTKQSLETPPVTVLAGDPKQLGPIIRSDIAKRFGLEKSLLERLTQMHPYARMEEPDVLGNHYDKRMITKLVHNYRSHPTILDLPNKAFYDGDLIAAAEVTRSHRFVDWEHLPTKQKFPIIFHGVEGEDMRESNSPSWFNPDEAQYVLMYVKLLIKDTKRNKCKPEDIGIITPYHRQVQKIRKLLDAHGYFDCKVGSVEEFQGSERPVIIISTVRSTVEHISFDQKHKLGFLANEKRFNVAITRAQALLIMIGNPFTLENDPNWKSMIEYAIDGGGYTGVEYTKKEQRVEDHSAIEDVISGIQDTDLEDENDSSDDDGEDFVVVSNVTAQEGPAWRSEE